MHISKQFTYQVALNKHPRQGFIAEACLHGQARALTLHLKHFVSLNVPCLKDPKSYPLVLALQGPRSGQTKILHLLLKKGADVNVLPKLWIQYPHLLNAFSGLDFNTLLTLFESYGLDLNQTIQGKTLWNVLHEVDPTRRPRFLHILLEKGLTCDYELMKGWIGFIQKKPLLDEWDLIVQLLPLSKWDPSMHHALAAQLGQRPIPLRWLDRWKQDPSLDLSAFFPFFDYQWCAAFLPSFTETPIQNWLARWERWVEFDEALVKEWMQRKSALLRAHSHFSSTLLFGPAPTGLAVQTGFNWLCKLEQLYGGVDENTSYHAVFHLLSTEMARRSPSKFEIVGPLLERAFLEKINPLSKSVKSISRL